MKIALLLGITLGTTGSFSINLLNASLVNLSYNEAQLLIAAGTANVEKVKQLINEKTKVNIKDMFGNTPLSVACKNGHAIIVKLLVKAGAQFTKKSMLRTAIYSNSIGSFSLRFLDSTIPKMAGIKVHPIFSANYTPPLYLACEQNHLDVVNTLIEAGVDVNEQQEWEHKLDEAPLHIVSRLGYVHLCNALIKAGANPNCRSLGGWTPLLFASKSGHTKIAEALIKAGAKIDPFCMNTACFNGHSGVVKVLLNAGAEPLNWEYFIRAVIPFKTGLFDYSTKASRNGLPKIV